MLKNSFKSLPKISQPLNVLFSDKGICVVDKPAGLVSQGGIDVAHQAASTGPYVPTLEDHFQLLQTQLQLPPGQTISTVHRLDKQTTGPLILSLNPVKAKDLSNQFKSGSIEKSYLAIVGRYMFAEERESHVENHVSWLRMDNGRVYNARPGEEGATRVENGWDWLGGDLDLNVSLIRLHPTTGHKHQLRVFTSRHLSAPVVGDSRYKFPAPPSSTKPSILHPVYDPQSGFKLPSDRFFLHCESIGFWRYLRNGKRVRETVRSELDEVWRANLERLRERVDPLDPVWGKHADDSLAVDSIKSADSVDS